MVDADKRFKDNHAIFFLDGYLLNRFEYFRIGEGGCHLMYSRLMLRLKMINLVATNSGLGGVI